MTLLILTSEHPVQEIGGKAANLARAAACGLPVPESLVLPRSSLLQFLEYTGLLEDVQRTLSDYKTQNWNNRLAAYEQLCSTIQKSTLPQPLRAEADALIADWLTRLPEGLAVRSSGIAEDSVRASFAGIYESHLGVTNLHDFWQAVRGCWCSAWSPQAAAYAHKMGLTLAADGMAVLIQPLVPAFSAGVIFTADPLTGNPWKFVINVVRGLSNRLMSGETSGDRFVLDWETGEILERQVAIKPTMSIFTGGTVKQVPLDEAVRSVPALDDKAIHKVYRMALIADRAFDCRFDIEWAFQDEEVVLLQARPLTALPRFFPHTLTPEQAVETWTPYLNQYGNMNASERLVAPLYRHRWIGKMWRRFLTPDDIFPRNLTQEMDFNGYRYATESRWEGSRHEHGSTEQWLVENEPRLRHDWLDQLRRAHQTNTVADEAAQRAKSAADWVRLTLALLREEYEMQTAVWYGAQWLGFNCSDLLKGFLNEAMPDADTSALLGKLLQGLPCYSVERTAEAQKLGMYAALEPFVKEAFTSHPLLEAIPHLRAEYPQSRFLQALDVYCRRFGLEVPTGEIKNSGSLDVEALLLVIKTSLQYFEGHQRTVEEIMAASTAQRNAAEKAVREHLEMNRPDQIARFNRLLDWAQFWVPALDDRKWHVAMTTRLGEVTERCGEALTDEGLIDHPNHFKLLTPEEWQDYADQPDPVALLSTYQASRKAYERNRRLEPLPYLGKSPDKQSQTASASLSAESTGQPENQASVATAGMVFYGEGMAPGVVRGIACKVENLEDPAYIERLTEETILVCATDIQNAQWRRDWYSLFLVVRGLVTIQGASLHHATQIARECGVPFINLPGVDFAALPDGAAVEIDGQTGSLRILSKPV